MSNKTNTYRPERFHIPLGRRRFLKAVAAASAGFTTRGFLAEALTLSPTVTQGPYYPLATNIPLDKDNDLVRLNDQLTAALGTVTYVSGRVLDQNGEPVRGALVELWQADHGGEYLYSASGPRNPAFDENFAGFGQFLTGASGEFLFRTVKAGLYVGRTRHLHWGITLPGETERTTTQTGWNETTFALDGSRWQTQNSNDNVFGSVSDAAQRQSMLLDFNPVEGTETGEEFSSWDYVAGRTYTEPTYPNEGGLVVEGRMMDSGRYELTVPAYAGYSYEVYGNPTMGRLSWAALPFSITWDGGVDRHIHTATSDGALKLYLDKAASRGFYYVSFRVPGANTGTPGSVGGGGGPGGPSGGRPGGPPPNQP